MRKIVATAVVAVACFAVSAAPASADTYNPGKTAKTEFLTEINASQSSDCYIVTFSDKFKNWAKITSNVAAARTCSLYEGEIWYKRPVSTGKWEFVDAGYGDLIVGVPAAVEKEFETPAQSATISEF